MSGDINVTCGDMGGDMSPGMSPLMSRAEAAKWAGMSPRQISRYRNDLEDIGANVGRPWKVTEEELRAVGLVPSGDMGGDTDGDMSPGMSPPESDHENDLLRLEVDSLRRELELTRELLTQAQRSADDWRNLAGLALAQKAVEGPAEPNPVQVEVEEPRRGLRSWLRRIWG